MLLQPIRLWVILDFSHFSSFISCPPQLPSTWVFLQFLMVKVLFLPQGLEFLPQRQPTHFHPSGLLLPQRGFLTVLSKTGPPPFISISILYFKRVKLKACGPPATILTCLLYLVYLHTSTYYL